VVIDSSCESLLTLAQAAAELPRRRGRKTNLSTLYRWTQAGCRGVQLESIQIGGTRCTSREALQRFFEALSERREPGTTTVVQAGRPVVGRTVAQRQRAAIEAGDRLKQMGA
jgi:hypothetical protein